MEDKILVEEVSKDEESTRNYIYFEKLKYFKNQFKLKYPKIDFSLDLENEINDIFKDSYKENTPIISFEEMYKKVNN